MPLNVRRSFASIFLVVFGFLLAQAQTAPTSAEVMRSRISKAKAFIAVKNFNAAIYELENIRRETNEPTVNSVLNVLLMNCYLEQGDYKRAQDFVVALANEIKANKPNATANFYAAAGQVIKGARNQSERYKALGLMVSDRNLPVEAVNDLENMRATLEKVAEQSKLIAKNEKEAANAFALLEETTNARSMLARDDYDAKRWKDEFADSREMLATSRSTVLNAVNDPTPETPVALNTVANNEPPKMPVNTLPVNNPTDPTPTATAAVKLPEVKLEPVKPAEPKTERVAEPKKEPESNVGGAVAVRRERRVVSDEPKTEEPKKEATPETVSNEPLKVGSLIEFAVERSNPIYPASARSMRQTGIVRIEVIVDETGKVVEVQNLSGPPLLQTAARDAVRKWRFRPFTRDGQPVKATGFVSFNFNL